MIYNGISKIQAAEEQLRMAIRLFFKNEDPISIHTLASASQEILEALGKKQGLKSMKLKSLELIHESKRKAFLKAMNDAKNAFKHADQSA